MVSLLRFHVEQIAMLQPYHVCSELSGAWELEVLFIDIG